MAKEQGSGPTVDPSPPLSSSRPLFRRSRASSSLLPRVNRKGRKASWATLVLRVAVLLVTVWATARAWRAITLRRAQHAARSSQQLFGFSESRLATIPADLQPTARRLSEEELLVHPLLLGHPMPTCHLNMWQQDRYSPLVPFSPSSRSNVSHLPHYRSRHHLKYFVALNLYESAAVLPTLIHTLHGLFSSLDPTRFHLSIFENGSKDDTPAQLYLLARLLDRLGVGYTIISDSKRRAGWAANERIANLASLRNLALKPLLDAPLGTFDRILFINDVHMCEADLMEILYQHEVQDADMSCGMDYKELRIKEFAASGYPLLFYDVWVARDMLGLPFYEIKYPTGDWVLPSPVLPQSPSRGRYQNLLPFQVFSCFNGVTVLDASLFKGEHDLRFRAHEGSDMHSECYLLCSDIWSAFSPWGPDGVLRKKGGRGAKIQIVPRTSVGYEAGEYEKARKDRNTTAFEVEGWQKEEADRQEMIDWKQWPPKLVTNYPYGHWQVMQSTVPF